jgi:hypothetical protein
LRMSVEDGARMPTAAETILQVDAVTARVRERLVLRGGNGGLLDRYLARLTPDRWTVEWHLPWWLGSRFGLDPDVALSLVVSNVLGLLAVRLSDDIADGELDPEDVEDAGALATSAVDQALVPYRELFSMGSPFWSFYERSMATWRSGAEGPDHAARAAPIKIAAVACCMLAERMDAWPILEASLDRAMTAFVLYDAFCDWEADLAAGRWNAFVASVVGDEPDSPGPARARIAVLTAMLTGDVVPEHFDRIAGEAVAAGGLAQEIGLDDLASYLSDWVTTVASQGADAAAHYHRIADQATRLVFQNAQGNQTAGGPR